MARPVGRIEKAWLWCKRRPAVASMLVVLLLAAIVVQQIVWHSRRQNDQRRTATLVNALLNARADAVPYTIDDLQPFEELATPILRKRFRDASLDRTQRLHAAFGLIAQGQMDDRYVNEVVNQVGDVLPAEYRNIETALRKAGESAKQKLAGRATAAATAGDARTQCRLAILLLYLGDETAAIECCTPPPDAETHMVDTTTRTTFIHLLPSWHGDASRLAEVLAGTQCSALRAALCLCVGLTAEDRLADNDRETLTPILLGFYSRAADGATHSAASWTLRQWKVPLPDLKSAGTMDRERGWLVNSLGMTLLKIPAGSFTMGSESGDVHEKPVHQVTLTKPYWLCDREVTVEQFQRFAQDTGYFKQHPDEEPKGWAKAFERFKHHSPESDCPVLSVRWYDAIYFCNWLSRREGKRPCYQKDGKEWKLDPLGTGFRLPTEAEWEYACRARSAKKYCFGDDQSLLDSYAVYRSSQTEPVGSKVPNAWGMFDTHGNVSEWIQDWYDSDYYKRSPCEDPPGPEQGTRRVLRGGSYNYTAQLVRAAGRNDDRPDDRLGNLGFRLARTYD